MTNHQSSYYGRNFTKKTEISINPLQPMQFSHKITNSTTITTNCPLIEVKKEFLDNLPYLPKEDGSLSFVLQK